MMARMDDVLEILPVLMKLVLKSLRFWSEEPLRLFVGAGLLLLVLGFLWWRGR